VFSSCSAKKEEKKTAQWSGEVKTGGCAAESTTVTQTNVKFWIPGNSGWWSQKFQIIRTWEPGRSTPASSKIIDPDGKKNRFDTHFERGNHARTRKRSLQISLKFQKKKRISKVDVRKMFKSTKQELKQICLPLRVGCGLRYTRQLGLALLPTFSVN
jgi:hypothetical protein